jgi:hypothetical protein
VERIGKGGVGAEAFDPGHRLDIAEAVVRDDAGAKIGDDALGGGELGEADPVAERAGLGRIDSDEGAIGAAVEAVDAGAAAQQIVAIAADQGVVAAIAAQIVAASAALEDIVGRVAENVVVQFGAGDVLDIEQRAAVAETVEHRIALQVDGPAGRHRAGDLGDAIAIAVDRLLQSSGDRRVVVVTDGNLARAEPFPAAALPVEVLTVGERIDNAAIVRVDVRASADPQTGKETVQAFALLGNFGEAAREVYVTLRQDNASDVLASRRLRLAPGERAPVVLSFESSPGDWRKGLVVDVAPRDAMPVDDVAWARVPAGDKMPVVVAAPDGEKPSPWLERVFAADPRADVQRATMTQLLQSTGIDPAALIVVDGACPPDVPGGDLLIVDPPAGKCWGAAVGPAMESPSVTSWDAADARMRFLVLDGVQVKTANQVRPEAASRELVRAKDGPLIADVSSASRTATLIGFDVGESDWPLKASFVLFARNVLDLARTHRERGQLGPQRTGDPVRVELPAGAAELVVTGPDGQPREASLQGGLGIVPDARQAGFYRVTWKGKTPGSLLVPVNLASEAESDVRKVVEAPASGAVTVREAASRPEAHREWSWLAALLVLALVVADVAWATRRPAVAPVATPAVPPLPERAPKR